MTFIRACRVPSDVSSSAVITTNASSSSIYAMMESGDFPRPIRIGRRAVAWPERPRLGNIFVHVFKCVQFKHQADSLAFEATKLFCALVQPPCRNSFSPCKQGYSPAAKPVFFRTLLARWRTHSPSTKCSMSRLFRGQRRSTRRLQARGTQCGNRLGTSCHPTYLKLRDGAVWWL
jgi:hypothetical protein